MTKLAPEWVRTSDPVIRSPARYRWTMAPAYCSMMDDDCNTIRDGGADDDQHEQPMQHQPQSIPPPMTAHSPIAQPQHVIQQVRNQNVAGAAGTAAKPYAVELIA